MTCEIKYLSRSRWFLNVLTAYETDNILKVTSLTLFGVTVAMLFTFKFLWQLKHTGVKTFFFNKQMSCSFYILG